MIFYIIIRPRKDLLYPFYNHLLIYNDSTLDANDILWIIMGHLYYFYHLPQIYKWDKISISIN